MYAVCLYFLSNTSTWYTKTLALNANLWSHLCVIDHVSVWWLWGLVIWPLICFEFGRHAVLKITGASTSTVIYLKCLFIWEYTYFSLTKNWRQNTKNFCLQLVFLCIGIYCTFYGYSWGFVWPYLCQFVLCALLILYISCVYLYWVHIADVYIIHIIVHLVCITLYELTLTMEISCSL